MAGLKRKISWRTCVVYWYMMRSQIEVPVADKSMILTTRSRKVPFWMYWDMRNQQFSQDAKDLRILHKIASSKDTLFFDLGAFIGKYSLYVSGLNPANSVCAFEPNSRSREILQKNIRLNRLESRIKVYNSALSDKDKDVFFVHSGQKSHISDKTGSAVPIKSMRLDSFVTESGLIPDIVKIDCEGYEVEVFEGGRNTLSGDSIWVFLEFHNDALRGRGLFDDFLRVLLSWERPVYSIDTGQKATPDDFNRGGHYLICPKEITAEKVTSLITG